MISPTVRTQIRAWALPVLGFCLYCLLLSLASIARFRAYNGDLDMGNLLQAFFGTLDGRFMEMTWNGTDLNACRWRGHTELFFVALLPFFAALPRAATLLTMQSIAVGAGGLAVYALSARMLQDRRTALALAVAYWCFPLLAAINLFDFHADPFFIAFFLGAWLSLRKGSDRWFWICVIAAAAVKENAAVVNGLLGCVLLFEHRRKGVLLIALALAQFFVITPTIRALAGGSFALPVQSHALGGGDTPWTYAAGVARAALQTVSTRDGVTGALIVLAAVHPVIFRFRRGLLMVVPLLWVALAAGGFSTHRHAALIAPVFICMIEGLAGLRRELRFRYALYGLLMPLTAAMLVLPPSVFAVNLRETLFSRSYRNVFHYRVTRHDALMDSLLCAVPDTAAIAADAHIRTKLADRARAFIHPYPAHPRDASWFLFDFFEMRKYGDRAPRLERCAALLCDTTMSLVANLDGIVILRRSGGTEPAFAAIRDIESFSGAKVVAGELAIDSCALERIGDTRYRMSATIAGWPPARRGDALVSLFIGSGGDTLRALHLAPCLDPRRFARRSPFREEFVFDTPPCARPGNRRHYVALYADHKHLTYFDRPRFKRAETNVQCGGRLSESARHCR